MKQTTNTEAAMHFPPNMPPADVAAADLTDEQLIAVVIWARHLNIDELDEGTEYSLVTEHLAEAGLPEPHAGYWNRRFGNRKLRA